MHCCWQREIRNHCIFLSNSRQVKSVDCNDFKTLYTNIPHDDLFNKIYCLLDIVLMRKVSENLKSVSWCQDFKSGGFFLFFFSTRNYVNEMLKYQLGNMFVKLKGNTYRSIIGVPMGCDCASLKPIYACFLWIQVCFRSNFSWQ